MLAVLLRLAGGETPVWCRERQRVLYLHIIKNIPSSSPSSIIRASPTMILRESPAAHLTVVLLRVILLTLFNGGEIVRVEASLKLLVVYFAVTVRLARNLPLSDLIIGLAIKGDICIKFPKSLFVHSKKFGSKLNIVKLQYKTIILLGQMGCGIRKSTISFRTITA